MATRARRARFAWSTASASRGFVDFVNGLSHAYDDNGHGTHVAGIIAGSGYDSYGAHAGIAPAAHLVSLKVLDRHGDGVISDVIAAFEWAVANRVAHNIRVINLSVGARVTESYETDPLTLAAKRAVDAGIVVVTAAGNLGQKTVGNSKKTQYGGITAPGNAPWVLTVGALQQPGHADPLGRQDRAVQLARSRRPSTTWPSPTSSRQAPASSRWRPRRASSTRRRRRICSRATGRRRAGRT